MTEQAEMDYIKLLNLGIFGLLCKNAKDSEATAYHCVDELYTV